VGAASATDTVADCIAVPFEPVQVSIKVEVSRIGPVDCEPFVLRFPAHAPEAAHLLAFSLVQVSVAEPPEATVLGLASSVTTGADVLTVTVTDCVAEPPGPRQVSSYSVVFVNLPVDQVPSVALGPLQPPLAAQAVASFTCQVRVEEPMLSIVVGEAARVIEGAGCVTTTSAD
jgi:hypothetical protein